MAVLLTLVENVNANVEEGSKYLTDVVQVAVTEITETNDGATTVVGYKVEANPAVISGYTTGTSTPVHPKTVGETIQIPTYTVPQTLKRLVRASVAEVEQDTAGNFANNWREQTVTVSPIVSEEFATQADAIKYYEAVVAQLQEGSPIRTIPVGTIRESHEFLNSRYPSF